MTITISKNLTKKDFQDIFGGSIPDCHPDHFIQSRLNDGFAFVAKEGDLPVGFLIYTIWWGNCPFIELIKIKDNYRRQGIGNQLLKTAAKDIYTKNYKELISSSEVINDMGKNFHKKCGFKEMEILNLSHEKEQFFKIKLEDLL